MYQKYNSINMGGFRVIDPPLEKYSKAVKTKPKSKKKKISAHQIVGQVPEFKSGKKSDKKYDR